MTICAATAAAAATQSGEETFTLTRTSASDEQTVIAQGLFTDYGIAISMSRATAPG